MPTNHERPVIVEERRYREKFLIVPLAIVTSTRLSDSAMRLYQILVSFVWGDKNACFPSQDTLARMCGKGERCIRMLLSELRDVGLISWVVRGEHRPNLYTIKEIPEEFFDEYNATVNGSDSNTLHPETAVVAKKPSKNKERQNITALGRQNTSYELDELELDEKKNSLRENSSSEKKSFSLPDHEPEAAFTPYASVKRQRIKRPVKFEFLANDDPEDSSSSSDSILSGMPEAIAGLSTSNKRLQKLFKDYILQKKTWKTLEIDWLLAHEEFLPSVTAVTWPSYSATRKENGNIVPYGKITAALLSKLCGLYGYDTLVNILTFAVKNWSTLHTKYSWPIMPDIYTTVKNHKWLISMVENGKIDTPSGITALNQFTHLGNEDDLLTLMEKGFDNA